MIRSIINLMFPNVFKKVIGLANLDIKIRPISFQNHNIIHYRQVVLGVVHGEKI